MDEKTIARLWEEYTGELLHYEDNACQISVKYSPGAIPIFSKLEVFIIDKSKIRTTQDQKELQKAFSAHQFRMFYPSLGLALSVPENVEEAVEEVERQVMDGLYSFIRIKNETEVEMLAVSVGSSKQKGLFYYPNLGSGELLPLIKLGEEGVKIYEENFRKVSEIS